MERLDHFMARANAAYYATHDPFADFTTSPEITQVFGEVLGLWAAVTWEAMGRPDPVLLVECGPGRGTLMADALRAVGRAAPAFRAALRLHLVETSPRLRAEQARLLPGATWHDSLEALPPGPMLLLANEFLDALPIRQFVRQGDGWMERFVADGRFVEAAADFPLSLRERVGVREEPPGPALAQDSTGEALSLGSSVLAASLTPALSRGERVQEVCEGALSIAAGLAGRIARDGGVALFLDYGPSDSAPGDSLQALRAGKPADPLAAPGEADLTAHVDFAALARAAGAARVHGPVPQGPFLARLGLFQRTGRLARTQPPAKAAALVQAAQRLAEPDHMGRLFKVLAIAHPALPVPAGFEP
jgi:NADH dehydrogenase [ubiquinone] 1 alpha subcomplex assembly factor 7